jgi:hypothetical protein
VLACLLALFLAAAAGRPLYYWGSRAPVIVAEVERGRGTSAQVEEVHAVMDKGSLVVRVSFDRPVAEVLHLPDGSPVSGRLQAVLYLDADADRKTGYDAGPADLRTGADYSLEIGVLALGEDPDENRKAEALITAALYSFQGTRRKTLWRGDESATASAIAYHGDWVDVRLPVALVSLKPGARMALSAGDTSLDGRIAP